MRKLEIKYSNKFLKHALALTSLALIICSCAPDYESIIKDSPEILFPETAKFRNVRHYPNAVCGVVISESAMGETTHRQFVIRDGEAIVGSAEYESTETNLQAAMFEMEWKDSCVGKNKKLSVD